MIPAGYMSKQIATRPDWLGVSSVRDIYSVSRCISEDFADYVKHWKHNGFWLFDSPDAIVEVAAAEGVSLEETKLFYYEVHEQEYDQVTRQWAPFSPDASFATNVVIPGKKSLEGYDVVNFYARNCPECSPLSCNGLGGDIRVNEHCLIPAREEAIAAVESGKFEGGEPGPLRVFAVYSVAVP
jgi:hypothetical protein